MWCKLILYVSASDWARSPGQHGLLQLRPLLSGSKRMCCTRWAGSWRVLVFKLHLRCSRCTLHWNHTVAPHCPGLRPCRMKLPLVILQLHVGFQKFSLQLIVSHRVKSFHTFRDIVSDLADIENSSTVLHEIHAHCSASLACFAASCCANFMHLAASCGVPCRTVLKCTAANSSLVPRFLVLVMRRMLLPL